MHPLCIPLICINLQFLSCSYDRENNVYLFGKQNGLFIMNENVLLLLTLDLEALT